MTGQDMPGPASAGYWVVPGKKQSFVISKRMMHFTRSNVKTLDNNATRTLPIQIFQHLSQTPITKMQKNLVVFNNEHLVWRNSKYHDKNSCEIRLIKYLLTLPVVLKLPSHPKTKFPLIFVPTKLFYWANPQSRPSEQNHPLQEICFNEPFFTKKLKY